jgi:hypothetical protein
MDYARAEAHFNADPTVANACQLAAAADAHIEDLNSQLEAARDDLAEANAACDGFYVAGSALLAAIGDVERLALNDGSLNTAAFRQLLDVVRKAHDAADEVFV